MLYGLVFVAIFSCFALMYRHAARRAEDLELDPIELVEARVSRRTALKAFMTTAAVGVP